MVQIINWKIMIAFFENRGRMNMSRESGEFFYLTSKQPMSTAYSLIPSTRIGENVDSGFLILEDK